MAQKIDKICSIYCQRFDKTAKNVKDFKICQIWSHYLAVTLDLVFYGSRFTINFCAHFGGRRDSLNQEIRKSHSRSRCG